MNFQQSISIIVEETLMDFAYIFIVLIEMLFMLDEAHVTRDVVRHLYSWIGRTKPTVVFYPLKLPLKHSTGAASHGQSPKGKHNH